MKTYKAKPLESYFAVFPDNTVIMVNLEPDFKGTKKELFAASPPENGIKLMIMLADEIPFEDFISKLNLLKDNSQYEDVSIFIKLHLITESGMMEKIMEDFKEFDEETSMKIKDIMDEINKDDENS